MVRTQCSLCQGLWFRLWSGNRDPSGWAAWPKYHLWTPQRSDGLLHNLFSSLLQALRRHVLHYSPSPVSFHLLVVVQSPSHVRLFATPWTAALQASLSPTISWNLPKFMFIASVMPSSHLILWHPLFLLPSIFPSIRDFFSESSVHIRWPKYWSFSISPSSEYSGLISLKIDWFDLLAIQGTVRSLLQHHSSEASVLWHSAFFMVQLSQLGPLGRP